MNVLPTRQQRGFTPFSFKLFWYVLLSISTLLVWTCSTGSDSNSTSEEKEINDDDGPILEKPRVARAKVKKRPIKDDSLKMHKIYDLHIVLYDLATNSEPLEDIEMRLIDTTGNNNTPVISFRGVSCLIDAGNAPPNVDSLYYCGRLLVNDTLNTIGNRYVADFRGQDIQSSSSIGIEFEDLLDCKDIVCGND